MKRSFQFLFVLAALLGPLPRPAYADLVTSAKEFTSSPGYKAFFKENEDKFFDWAFANSKEATMYRDLLNGRNGAGGQISLFYLKRYVSGDVGYATFYEEKQRGTPTIGSSLRVMKIMKDIFYEKPEPVEGAEVAEDEPKTIYDHVFVGVWYAYSTTNSEHMAGVKGGYGF